MDAATSPAKVMVKAESYPFFDWLRLILASVVVLVHAGILTWEPASNLAVQIFFALSGWLIGGILLDTSRSELPRFFYNRVTRIWLPYAFAIAALYGLSLLREGYSFDWLRFLIADLLFTHNWFIEPVPEVLTRMPLEGTGHHFWSIAVEEQFYLIAPVLIVSLKWGRSPWVWAGIAVATFAMQSFFASISLGVLAAVLARRSGAWHLTSFSRPLFIALAAAAFMLMIAFPSIYPWAAPPFSIIIVLLSAIAGERNRLGEFFGGMSYPLYLNHWLGLFIANGLVGSEKAPFAYGTLAYALAFAISAIAYWLIDRNVLQYRGRYFSQRRGTACAVMAYGLIGCGFLWTLNFKP